MPVTFPLQLLYTNVPRAESISHPSFEIDNAILQKRKFQTPCTFLLTMALYKICPLRRVLSNGPQKVQIYTWLKFLHLISRVLSHSPATATGMTHEAPQPLYGPCRNMEWEGGREREREREREITRITCLSEVFHSHYFMRTISHP